ncbi:alpha-E domain-containing protein [Limoniibacter endophyticus]|uniref:DUF403 domain-containing protein n=1 Tax=Limoniibacter endophyticus TaxID=1565040 RepID=A0A8J3DLS1_9HYPH|nr:alpha-E domain-containing protein [Limoniibacter endophyticus]GHC81316.1 hypothetical protein GCM10010136_34860 [Limoniibacter endophyticus]
MLGRTADGLYWMFRHIERAENIARLIDAGLRMSLTRTGEADDEWDSVLRSAGMHASYLQNHEKVTGSEAIHFMLSETNNPSSVLSAITSARLNGRMVRTALTRETWEAMNECWIAVKAMMSRTVRDTEMPAMIDAIKQHTALIRGSFHGTMLRNEIYSFARIGTFIERADNTARILDVKYYVLLPSISYVGSSLDNVQWESILRSVSAHRSYSWVYDTDYRPINIADFLILNRRMPRSLAFCHAAISENLLNLERDYGQRHPAHDTAQRILSQCEHRTIDEIFDRGLHEFLLDFIIQNNRLGSEIARAYNFH